MENPSIEKRPLVPKGIESALEHFPLGSIEGMIVEEHAHNNSWANSIGPVVAALNVQLMNGVSVEEYLGKERYEELRKIFDELKADRQALEAAHPEVDWEIPQEKLDSFVEKIERIIKEISPLPEDVRKHMKAIFADVPRTIMNEYLNSDNSWLNCTGNMIYMIRFLIIEQPEVFREYLGNEKYEAVVKEFHELEHEFAQAKDLYKNKGDAHRLKEPMDDWWRYPLRYEDRNLPTTTAQYLIEKIESIGKELGA